MMHLLSDGTKFIGVNTPMHRIIQQIEDKLSRNLLTLKSQHRIDDILYHQIFLTGSTIGSVYDSPKIHKSNCPLRPIVT